MHVCAAVCAPRSPKREYSPVLLAQGSYSQLKDPSQTQQSQFPSFSWTVLDATEAVFPTLC